MRRTLLTIALLAASLAARADDWPQWLGPLRDGVWRESGVASTFPPTGPRIRWRAAVGGGYAGPAVAAGRVFVTDRLVKADAPHAPSAFNRIIQPGTERVLCLNESDGKALWTYEYDAAYSISYNAGPRATPTVDGNRVYTLGAEGHLACLDAATGKAIWSKELSGPETPTPIWGFTGHPLVDGDKLICLTAGRNSVVTAFNKLTGAVLWSAITAESPGYSAPMIYTTRGGLRLLVLWDPEKLSALDPETGKIYWSEPYGPVRNGVSIVTPRHYCDSQLGDLLMVSSAGEGMMVVKLDAREPKESVLWKRGGKTERKTDAIHALNASPVMQDGNVYGVCINGELRCLDLRTGDRLWESLAPTNGDAVGPQRFTTAFLVPNGDRFYIANDHGDLIVAKLTPQGYQELGRCHLIDPTNSDPGRPVLWSHPAFANRSIYWRNDRELVCASLADESSSAAAGASLDQLVEMAQQYKAGDAAALEALAAACKEREDAFYPYLLGRMGQSPLKWSDAMAEIAARLHVVSAIPAFKDRAMAATLSAAQRRQAIDAIAITGDPAANKSLAEVAAKGPEDLRAYAAEKASAISAPKK